MYKKHVVVVVSFSFLFLSQPSNNCILGVQHSVVREALRDLRRRLKSLVT